MKDGNTQNTLHRNELGSAISLLKLSRNKKQESRFLLLGLRGTLTMLIVGAILGTLLVGLLFGLRFKVFVLVPIVLIAACAIIATGHGLKAIALTILATATVLQIGYVVGLVVRVWVGPLGRRSKSKLLPIVTGAPLSGHDNLGPLDYSRFDLV